MISGYALSTFDTVTFEATCAKEWWHKLQAKYQAPDVWDQDKWSRDNHIEHEIFNPTTSPTKVLEDYPSHGHINLLSHAQGKGLGEKLMMSVRESLMDKGSPGMHLRVSGANFRALGFYDKLGYSEIMRRTGEVIVGARYN